MLSAMAPFTHAWSEEWTFHTQPLFVSCTIENDAEITQAIVCDGRC